jgi:porin
MASKLTWSVAVLLAYSGSVHAGAPQNFGEDLLLDWDDLRGILREQGIDIRIGYVSETATNVQGGSEKLWRYTDQWTFSSTLDLQKLFGWNHAQFNLIVTDRNGDNLSADALGSLEEVQEIYGRNQTWRWTEISYEQTYFQDRVDLKFGRTSEGDDFASFSCEFMNLTFCGSAPGNIVGSYWYNWPVSQWSARVKVNIPGLGYFQLGAYEVDPGNLLTRYALDVGSPPNATGVLLPAEIAWLPIFGQGLEGSYKFGAWYNTATATDVVENTRRRPLAIYGGTPLGRHGQYGAYINFLQRVTSPSGPGSKRGLNLFLNAVFADRRTSRLANQIALGLLYSGPFVSRPKDEIGVALGETHVNHRVGDVEEQLNALGNMSVSVQSSEWVSEIFYNVNFRGWLDLRPNIQYVNQPAGSARNANDLVLGLKLVAAL